MIKLNIKQRVIIIMSKLYIHYKDNKLITK